MGTVVILKWVCLLLSIGVFLFALAIGIMTVVKFPRIKKPVPYNKKEADRLLNYKPKKI